MVRLQEFTRRQIIILSVFVVTIISIVAGSLYLSHKYHSYPQELVAVDSLCESNIDSAAILLNNHISTTNLLNDDLWYLRLLKLKIKVKRGDSFRNSNEANELLAHFNKDVDNPLLPQALYCAGCVYSALYDIPQAIECFQRALDIVHENKKNYNIESLCCYQLGYLLSMQGLDKEAIPWQKKALMIHIQNSNTERCIYDCENIAWSYRNIEKVDSSYVYLYKAWTFAKTLKDDKVISEIASQFASIYKSKGDLLKAQHYIEIALRNPQTQSASSIYSMAAEIYSKLGETKLAEQYCDSVMNRGNVYGKQYVCKLLTDEAIRKKEIHSIYLYYTKYKQYSDSIENISPVEAVANANAMYNYALRERHNAMLEKENSIQRTYIIMTVSLIVILFLLVVILVIVSLQRKKRMEERLELLRKSLKCTELNEEDICHDNVAEMFDMQMTNTDVYKELLETLKDNSECSFQNWQLLSETIYKVYPMFRTNLQKLKRMSEVEFHVCLLLKIRLSMSDIAKLVCRSQDTVYSICRRLYKKNYTGNPSAKKWRNLILSM